MSHRREQLASTLRREVQLALDRGLNDPRLEGMITITGITLSPDLSEATISVSVLPERNEDLAMHGLRGAAGRIRRDVGDRVAMARVPQLRFTLDRRLKDQAAVLAAINKATAELERGRGAQPTGKDEGPT